MSQGKNDRSDKANSNINRASEHYKMLYQGRAFSGHERNCCFLNTLANPSANKRFATISAVSGIDIDDDGRALVQVDWDHDGDLDLWISNRNAPRMRFFRNDSANPNRFVDFKLVGNGADTNLEAYGARVKVVLKSNGQSQTDGDAPSIIRTLRAGEGFVSQSSQWVHFGLGETAEIEHVFVTWPNKNSTTEDFGPVASNGRFVLAQGSGKAEALPARSGDLVLKPSATEVPPTDMVHRIPLIYPLNVSELGYFGFDGSAHDVVLSPKQVTLLNLWSTSCKPCIKELTEFVRRADELKAAGIRVIALNVDALETGQADAANAAKEMATRLKLSFEAGMAPAAVIEDLRLLHDALITLDRPLPMPSSFLINREGKLSTIYKGPVEVNTLLEDARDTEKDVLARYQRTAAFPGSLINDDVINSAMVKNQAMVHYKRAKQLIANRMFNEAEREYRILVPFWPESGSILNDLAVLLLMKNNHAEATQLLTQAMELKPEDAEIRFNLARALDRANKRTEAQSLLEASIGKFPDHANLHFMMGILKTREKDLVGAKASFEKAVENNPRHDQALFALANLLASSGDIATAKKHLLQALRISPEEPALLVGLGKIYIRERNWPEAEKTLRLAIQKQPQFAEAQFQLGLALAGQDKMVEARKQFEATLRLDRNFPGALEALQQTLRNNLSKN